MTGGVLHTGDGRSGERRGTSYTGDGGSGDRRGTSYWRWSER